MFRKALLSTLTAAILATSAFAPSVASASDFGKEVPPVSNNLRGKDVAAGLALGAAVVILGAIASHNQNDDRFSGRKQRRHHDVRHDDDFECFDKPIRKYSHKRGKMVTVGFKTICR